MTTVTDLAPAVSTRALGRIFQRRKGPPIVALREVSLRVERGEVHGLLGPNGAGKSTLMKLLSTILLPNSGSAHVCGHDVVTQTAAARRSVAVVFGGDRGLYPRLTARENLRYWAALYGLDPRPARQRTEELLDRFSLLERAGDRVETYSTGMRQRLHLARGLISSPQLLLLDEPTNGLDPVEAGRLREAFREIAGDGRTVLLATHDMAEAEAVCDRVTLINHGSLVLTEATERLGQRVLGTERIEVVGADDDLLARVARSPGVTAVTSAGPGTARIEVSEPSVVGSVLHDLVDAGVTSVRTLPPSLEEVYLHLVGVERV
ncbi:MAG: ATP-binding cassette domain-containing protein [Micromonosporaceae bacterium]